jgi:nitroreductase
MSELANLIKQRRSIRRFLTTPIDQNLLKNILDEARHAPSGSNMQPWNLHILQGNMLRKIIDEVQKEYDLISVGVKKGESVPYDYYPKEWFSPYIERRKATGIGLYSTLGISKHQKSEMIAQQRRNYQFFDAPCGIICTIDKRLGTGSYLDYGLFLQNIVLLAQEHGLGTCLQASFLPYQHIFATELNFHEHEQLLCAVAIGFVDHSEIILDNKFQPNKKELESFITWHY